MITTGLGQKVYLADVVLYWCIVDTEMMFYYHSLPFVCCCKFEYFTIGMQI